MGERALLRIGLLVEGDALPAWQHRSVSRLAEGDGTIALVATLADAPRPPRTSPALRAFERLDRRLFGAKPDPLARIDARPLFTGAVRLEARWVPRAAAAECELDAETLRAIAAHDLDALLQLAGPALGRDTPSAARLGLWTFAHEDAQRRGGRPFHAALVASAGRFEVALLAHTADDTRVLQRSGTTASAHSLARTLEPALWRAAELPARACATLAIGGESRGDAALPPDRAARPGALAIAGHVLASAARVARNRARLRRHDRVWFVALRRRPAAPIESDPLAGFEPLPCPIDRFHADPMLVRDGNAHHLFFEDADRASGHGVIAWRAIDAAGRAGPIERVLEMDTHLSYPFVFAWRGTWFLIPETSARRSVELWRATEFPLRWRLETVLFRDVEAVDTTIVEHGGRLWLFTAMSSNGASINDELHLFHAEAPTGPWRPHPMNPVVSDVRHARPAGALFREGAALFRPGQDCEGDYGAAFWIHRVDALDERSYRETPVRRIAASWHPGGLCTHTITRAGDFEAMDNRVWKRRL